MASRNRVTALLCLLVVGTLAHATSIWISEVIHLAFLPSQAALRSEQRARLTRAASHVVTSCGPELPAVVLTGILPDNAKRTQKELASARIANVKQELKAMGVPDNGIYDVVYSASQYREHWRTAPGRAQAPVHSVEVELSCRPK